jgi:hypothetical protein
MAPWFVKAPLVAGAVIAIVSQQPALADLIDPNDPNLAFFNQQQGDFSTVALGWATDFYGSKYDVQSSPGLLQNSVVAMTGSNGLSPNGAGIETPTQSSQGGNPPYFQIGVSDTSNPTSLDANGNPVPHGTSVTWDASISALNAKLGGGPAVIYFNMAETGKEDLLSGTDLLAWAKVTLHDSADPSKDFSFYLTGETPTVDKTTPDPVPQAADVDPNDPYNTSSAVNPNGAIDPRWSYVSGNFCVDDAGLTPVLLHFGGCTNKESDTNAKTIKNNQGANQAAFAIYNLDLSNAIAAGGLFNGVQYDTLMANFEFSNLDDGAEQIFLASIATSTAVPEPASMALLGIALAKFGWSMHRRRRYALV